MAGRTLLRVIPARQLDFLLEAEMAQERDECSDRDAARGRADAAAREEVDAEAARANGWWWRRLASRFSKKVETSGGGVLPEADPEAVPLIALHSRPDPSTSNTPSIISWSNIEILAFDLSRTSPPWGNWLSIQTLTPLGLCLFLHGPAGLLGLTVNVIMFAHWMLAANAVYAMWFFLALVSVYFPGYWIRCGLVGEI
ncbi:hypothetical protein ZWY2020_042023 [Hordeum vulgare]|nr:hypothetical protein ZWY2020_042023 [Hordeum vulgare]